MTSLSTRGLKRVIREIEELNKSRENLVENGIYFHVDEEDMSTIYAMIVGTSDTPYENGYYFFKIHFKGDYPIEPPKVHYFTQGMSVRFNPNLYVADNSNGGRVCLSMINTWSGPGWVPTYTVINILMAIQALVLIDEPLRNEPGYTDSNNKEVIDKYSKIITYCNFKVAILDMITKVPDGFEMFQDVVIDIFNKNKNDISAKILSYINQSKYELGKVSSPCYSFVVNINYKNLYSQYQQICKDIEKKLN